MGAYKSTNKLKSQSEWRFHILLNNDLRLNLFGLETQYHFDMLLYGYKKPFTLTLVKFKNYQFEII